MGEAQNQAVLKGLCILSRLVSEQGRRITYMVRGPATDPQDSGWRFFAGDEPDEYLEDPGNFVIRKVSDAVSMDPTILPHLDVRIPAILAKDPATGRFVDCSPRRPMAQKVCGVLIVGLVILAMVHALAAMLFYLPPYSWLANVQVQAFGGHLPCLTYFVGMVVLLMVAFAVAVAPFLILARRAARLGSPWASDAPRFAEAIFPGRQPLPGDAPSMRRLQAFLCFMPAIAPLLVGLGFAGYGVYELANVREAGEPLEIDVSVLSDQRMPASPYVLVKATPAWEQQIEWSTGSGISHYYAPLPSVPTRETGQTRLFIRVSPYGYAETAKQQQFQGILVRNGMPGEVAARFESRGILPGTEHLLLDAGATPDSAAFSAWFAMGIGGVLALVSLVVGARHWLRSRKDVHVST